MIDDEVAAKALRALRAEDPHQSRAALERILEEAPDRMDVLHALAVTLLRLGEPEQAMRRIHQAERIARERADDSATAIMGQIVLARAAACEDLYDPAGAEAAYREILDHEPGNPAAATGLAYLLFAWGRGPEGEEVLSAYLDDALDEPDALAGNRAFLDAWRRLHEDDVHPRMFLEAHRGSYVEFFDHHANRMAEKGWIAEAARMHRDEFGEVVPTIPEGARPYAAVRVDLVDPATGQPGLVGDQPMIVALAGYEPLARAPALVRWPERDHPFPVWVSTQAPWDQLPVQVAVDTPSVDAAERLDATIGDWYQAGFHGSFGTADRGRFHFIGDPEAPGGGDTIVWNVDCGRAELSAISDLLKRLVVLHERVGLRQVVLGRGYVPA
ncbi:MAG: hypothetical protein D6798_01925 [Deltaproteobacteria bacterium]|nr:MAG: hypothetical protein D6798_01925 [Deltaproteobacteria bacterium]